MFFPPPCSFGLALSFLCSRFPPFFEGPYELILTVPRPPNWLFARAEDHGRCFRTPLTLALPQAVFHTRFKLPMFLLPPCVPSLFPFLSSNPSLSPFFWGSPLPTSVLIANVVHLSLGIPFDPIINAISRLQRLPVYFA